MGGNYRLTLSRLFAVLSMLACVLLGELFFFHMLLIRKGITTYEYVVALRAMSETLARESVTKDRRQLE